MKLTVGAMKPHMYEFIQKGIDALKTPEMQVSIRHGFAEHARISYARMAAGELRAAREGAELANELAVHIPDGLEEENFDGDEDMEEIA